MVGLESLDAPDDGSAVTIGTFDGVHIGHRALIAATIDEARERGATATAITWDRHPNTVLRPDRAPPLITTPERKVELLGETGLDALVVLPFTKELSQWPPDQFVTEVLAEGLGARAVVVGEGWRFGHKASGDVALLEKMGAECGFDVRALSLFEAAGEPASSSRVRAAVEAGELDVATALLARPFDVDGTVVRGDDRGVSLGYPTANLETAAGLLMPPRGVYAGRGRARGVWYAAAINLGVNPTFGGDPESMQPRIEAFLLDFHGDLYGEVLRVEFHTRLRDERKFDSAAELVEQIGRDVADAARIVGG